MCRHQFYLSVTNDVAIPHSDDIVINHIGADVIEFNETTNVEIKEMPEVLAMEESSWNDLETSISVSINDVALSQSNDLFIAVSSSSTILEDQSSGIGIRPTGVNCPPELRVVDGNGAVVACKSVCDAFNVPEFRCTGEHATPAMCAPIQCLVMFKAACDDASSTFTCSGSDYLITLCPTNSI